MDAILMDTPSRPKRTRKPAPPVLRARPGPAGRKILAAVAAINELWPKAPDERKEPEAYERHVARHRRLRGKALAAVRGIARHKPRTLSDLVDKAIALMFVTETFNDRDHLRLFEGLLAVGGVTLDDMDEERWAEAA